MPDSQPLRLVAGVPGPVQRLRNDCGPTVLATARMLLDPAFAASMTDSGPARLAAYQAVVHRRTTALHGPTGRWQLPWPPALGTPPWAAARELEAIARSTGHPDAVYRVVPVRLLSAPELARVVGRLHAGLRRTGLPGVLYVGSALLPRHVTLLVGGDELLVHDPADGAVGPLDGPRLGQRRAYLGGWTHPWLLVGPVS